MRRLELTTVMLLGSLAFAGSGVAHAPKQGDIWATVGPVGYRTRTIAPVATEAARYGLGIVAEGDVDYNGGVEIAMIYVDKLYVRERNDATLAEHIKRMYVTTGYRHWFAPWVSMGLAFFSSYSMGDAKIVEDERPPGTDWLTTARDITEYGVDASLQWEIFGADEWGIVADARYSFSTSRKSHEAADLYSVLLGFKYLVPKKGG